MANGITDNNVTLNFYDWFINQSVDKEFIDFIIVDS